MKLNKIIAPLLAGAMVVALAAPVGVNAAEVATGSNAVEVYATQSSTFTVTIPKTIILDGKLGTGAYSVDVKGNISGTDIITVTPDAEFVMKQAGKDDIKTTVTPSATEFSYANGVKETGSQTETGLIEMESISAGKWAGQFNFTITSNVDVEAEDSVASVEDDITNETMVGIDTAQEKESVYDSLTDIVEPEATVEGSDSVSEPAAGDTDPVDPEVTP